jgi:hypothetical protein
MIDKLIQTLVKAYNSNDDISDILYQINEDNDYSDNQLTLWGSNNDFNEDFVFIVPKNHIPIGDDEDIADYFILKDLSFESNVQALNFMKEHILEASEQEYAVTLHIENYSNSCISYECEIWGQGGPHFSNLNIFDNKNECHKAYKHDGYFLVANDKILNTDEEIIKRWNEFKRIHNIK